ncbi:MAG: hypothetical protein E7280_07020 [Lachnospiraceae bacterium]|nr:hypothetical protein [Lachnospiraceae bacterium]
MDNMNMENNNLENTTMENNTPTPEVMDAPTKGNKNKAKWIALGVVALVIIVAAVLIVPKLVMGKEAKILQALENTFKPDLCMETLTAPEFQDGSYTVAMQGDATLSGQSGSLKLTMATDLDKKQAMVDIGFTMGNLDVSLASAMDGKQIRVGSSFLPEGQILTYNYDKKVTGYLADMAKEAGMNLDDFNTQLQKAFDKNRSKEWLEKTKDATMEAFDELEFEDAKEKEFTVNGEKQKCTGYKATITKEWAEKLLDSYKEIWKEYVGKENLNQKQMDELFKSIDELPAKMEKATVSFYIYEKQIAAIELESADKEKFSLLCEGGKDKETFKLVGGEDTIVIERSMKKDVQCYAFSMDGETLLTTSFDAKKKELQYYVGKEGNEVTITMTFSPDAKISEAVKGTEEVNLNDLDEAGFQNLVQSVGSAFYSSMYGF